MKDIIIPFVRIEDNKLVIDKLLIGLINNKYFFGFLEKNKLKISNDVNLLKKFLNKKYVDILTYLFQDNKELIIKTYNFFYKNSPSFLNTNELKQIDLNEINISKLIIDENTKNKFINMINNQNFNFVDLNYKIYKNENRKNKEFKFDVLNNIEASLASVFQINDKMAFLFGTTGVGKTYSIKELAKRNNLKTYYTAVSNIGDARIAIMGQKTLETENGKQKVSHNPGAGLMAFREVVEEKEDAVLIVDEILRGNSSDITTIFSIEKDENNNKFFSIEGIEYYYIIEIENIKGEKAKVLLADRNVSVDFKNGKILKPAPIELNKKEIEELMKNGNISKVTEDFLEKFNYKILNKLEKIKEHFYIPVDKLKVCMIANVGEDFIMSKIDSATISRSGTIIIDNTKIKPQEMLDILKGNNKQNITKMRKLTIEEEKLKEQFLIEFFKVINTGIKIENISLPKRAYSLRNLETLYSVKFIPENKDIFDYYNEIINDLFILNYVDFEIGKENIEPNIEQLNYINQSIKEIKNKLQNKKEITFDLEKEFDEEQTINQNKKVVL